REVRAGRVASPEPGGDNGISRSDQCRGFFVSRLRIGFVKFAQTDRIGFFNWFILQIGRRGFFKFWFWFRWWRRAKNAEHEQELLVRNPIQIGAEIFRRVALQSIDVRTQFSWTHGLIDIYPIALFERFSVK